MPSDSVSVRLSRLSFSFHDVLLLNDVTVQLTSGWCGLVGANGAGKSTLLRLLTGELKPTEGSVTFTPRHPLVLHIRQQTHELDQQVQTLAQDPRAGRLRAELGLNPAGLARWPTLSPGERQRWQVGAALQAEPDVLLMDEPTNHLDAEGRAELLAGLGRFRGVGLVVSHDRALLDALTTRTLRVRDGKLDFLEAPYSQAREQWQAEDEEARTAYERSSERLNKARRVANEDRRRLESASQQRSTGRRMKSRHDSDARTLGADFRAEMAERAHASRLRRTVEKVERLSTQLAEQSVRFEDARRLTVAGTRAPRPRLGLVPAFVMRHGRRLVGDTPLLIERTTRLRVLGPNGAGKSSLLGVIREECALPPERVLWLPQELSPTETEADLEALRALEPAARGRVLQFVDALGVDPEVLLATLAPSPGEARKLRLALGLVDQAWLALLDEPTNHLDLPAIEQLERALGHFEGALVLVTHDEPFAEAVKPTMTWRVPA